MYHTPHGRPHEQGLSDNENQMVPKDSITLESGGISRNEEADVTGDHREVQQDSYGDLTDPVGPETQLHPGQSSSALGH